MNIVRVSFENNQEVSKYFITPSPDGDDIYFMLNTSVDKNYMKEVSPIDEIMAEFNNYYKESGYVPNFLDSLKLKKIENLFERNYNLYKHFDYILFESNYDDALEFLKNNPELKNEKIVLNNVSFSEDDLKVIINKFKDYDIYVKASHGQGFCSLKKYQQAYNTLDDFISNIREAIKKYNLSPIEQLMLVYDVVRDRVYTEEEKSDNLTASRDLTNVLSGDKIVCTGFANLFDEIIHQLGFNGSVYNLNYDSDESGHSRNIVYVNDDKHKINGLYFFDTTWDSPKCKGDLSYLNSYKFFAKTKSQMDEYYKFDSEDCMLLASDLGEKFMSSLSEVMLGGPDMIRTVNKISKIIDGKMLLKLGTNIDYDGSYKKIEEYSKLADNPIDIGTFINILINVRNAEKSIDKKYLLDGFTLAHTVINSNVDVISKLGKVGELLIIGEIDEKIKHLKKF